MIKDIVIKPLLVLAVTVLLGACVNVDELGMDENGAIRFITSAQSRSAVNGSSLPDGSSFYVWGYRTPMDGEIVLTDFDKETVTREGGIWNYTGGTRYWFSGYVYDFYAVYPSEGINVSCTSEGNIAVTDFDATRGIDLMTASRMDVRVSENNIPDAVVFNFQHLLAKVQFVARSEGGNATVEGIELSGIRISGNYTESENPLWKNLQEGIISVEKTTTVTTSENTDVSGDLLLIPQTLEKPVVTVTYSTEVEKNKRVTYSLPVDVVAQWSAAQAYRYTFTITGGGYIIFDVPTVTPWRETSGGNVIIDVTQQSDT